MTQGAERRAHGAGRRAHGAKSMAHYEYRTQPALSMSKGTEEYRIKPALSVAEGKHCCPVNIIFHK